MKPGVALKGLTRPDWRDGLEVTLAAVSDVLDRTDEMSADAAVAVHDLCDLILNRVENVLAAAVEPTPPPAQRPVPVADLAPPGSTRGAAAA